LATAAVSSLAPTLLGAELVAEVRALRMAPGRLPDGPARHAFELAAAALDAEVDDRPLGADLERAVELLPALPEAVSDEL
jgi:histidine ammonia-lyase